MTFYPDLSIYSYTEHSPGALNIGWLGGAQPYRQGEVPAELIERLWTFCRTPVCGTRGLHECELCATDRRSANTAQRDEETITLGSAEIRVFGPQGRIYAAPNLIYHYVIAHRYQPPHEFITAVLEGPLPGAPEYEALAAEWPWYGGYRRLLEWSKRERLVKMLKGRGNALARIRQTLPEVTSDDLATFVYYLGTARFEWRDESLLRALTKLDAEAIAALFEANPDLISRDRGSSGNSYYRLKPETVERLLRETLAGEAT